MRTRYTMAFLMVVTLFANLAHHRGRSSAQNTNQDISKRKLLERLLRLTSTSPRPSFEQRHHKISTSGVRSAITVPLTTSQTSRFFHWYFSTLKDDPEEASFKFPSSLPNPQDNWKNEPIFGPVSAQRLTQNFINESRFEPEDPPYPSRINKKKKTYYEPSSSLPNIRDIDSEDSFLSRRHAPSQSRNSRRKERKNLNKKKKEQKNRNKAKRKKRKEDKRLEQILRRDDVIIHNFEGEDYLDCCPSKIVVIEKQVGKDRSNHAVHIRPSHQLFYERICLPDIEGNECVFPSHALKRNVLTRCAQQYSFVLAQVRPYNTDDADYHLDYIHVRSGCSCQVSTTPRRRKKKKKKKRKR